MAINEIIINPNKVAIYCRWSTDEQTYGTTCDTQLTGCKNYILSQGWNINEGLIFIDDGWSGGNLDRPHMKILRELIQEREIECVVVHKLDRLSRSLQDAVNLVVDEWEDIAYLKSVTEPISTDTMLGRQIFYVLMSFAEFERENIKMRTWSGKVKRAQEGKNAGFKPPYGYTIDKNKPGYFIVVPEERDIVLRIYDMYKQGKGCKIIANTFNGEGLKFIKGRVWNEVTIYNILSNSFYYGNLQYGKNSRNHKRKKNNDEPFWIKNENLMADGISPFIEPIISKERWDRIQEIKKEKNVKNSRVSGRSYNSSYLLTGICFCSNCGHAMSGTRNFKGGVEKRFYRCRGYVSKGSNFCENGYVNQEVLDNIIIDSVKEDFIIEANREKLKESVNKQELNDIKFIQMSINNLEKDFKKLSNELDKITNDYKSGDLGARVYNDLYEQIYKDKMNIELLLHEKRKELVQKKTNLSNNNVDEFADILINWENYSIAEQKFLLKHWIYRINVFKKRRTKDLEVNIIFRWDKDNYEKINREN